MGCGKWLCLGLYYADRPLKLALGSPGWKNDRAVTGYRLQGVEGGAKDDVHSPRRIDLLRYDVLLPAGTLRDDGRRQV